MAPKYLKDQPAGFKNRIENVAVVGVCITVLVNSLLTISGWRSSWQIYYQSSPQNRKAQGYSHQPS
jgi:hypothetical protein